MISYYFTLTLRTVEIDNIRVITYNVHVHTLSYFISFFVTEIVLTNIALVLYRVCACVYSPTIFKRTVYSLLNHSKQRENSFFFLPPFSISLNIK